MRYRWLGLWIGVVSTCLLLAACKPNTTAANNEAGEPAILENVASPGLHRVILTKEAAQRIDLQTAQVEVLPVNNVAQLTVPYSAVIYDPRGGAWVYKNIAPLTYIRVAITINAIQGNNVIFSNGPPVGTPVVTVGATELYGAEYQGSIQP